MQNDKHRSEENMKSEEQVVGRSVEPVVGNLNNNARKHMIATLLFSCSLACIGFLAAFMQAVCMSVRDSSIWPVVIVASIISIGLSIVIPMLRRAFMIISNPANLARESASVDQHSVVGRPNDLTKYGQ